MTISVGFTTAEIREFVHEYQLLPHGTKGAWLAERGLSYDMVRRWRSTVFEGDLDRGLVPRESRAMAVPQDKRTAFEKERAQERAAQEAEVKKLTARIKELEDTNTALGKAIGLLHAMNEQEPTAPPTTTAPSDSSTTRMP
ncbi:hypothetical protein SAMN02745244_03776 [Tessaracoccus bendigoensis DSM 12906]|uniref:Transposase n=2 Tax=Tessaracoccus bendigoensis DSM 12906 TaxID=1123357 RepID=A0A1M6P593_9ACTN|nr:hypothetical protein [Tessaracoccus bendigoensis]SHK03129.1 hypothetical protein SAMN02745244_03776 [Tessaracoccus bendigoensis DSM 12906]